VENGKDISQGNATAETASRTRLNEQFKKHSFGRRVQGDYHNWGVTQRVNVVEALRFLWMWRDTMVTGTASSKTTRAPEVVVFDSQRTLPSKWRAIRPFKWSGL
jgi:hypothetical protein